MIDNPNAAARELLKEFLDWYDPEASHRDIGLDGPVDSFIKERYNQ